MELPQHPGAIRPEYSPIYMLSCPRALAQPLPSRSSTGADRPGIVSPSTQDPPSVDMIPFRHTGNTCVTCLRVQVLTSHYNASLLWGTYRPGFYFGTRSRTSPGALMTGVYVNP